jgi:hypothetical protein
MFDFDQFIADLRGALPERSRKGQAVDGGDNGGEGIVSAAKEYRSSKMVGPTPAIIRHASVQVDYFST